jgi:DtxR family Mn-dependent transcriptional regulator
MPDQAGTLPPHSSGPESPVSPGLDLSDSGQDYLEAVYLLVQRHGVARMKEIASLVDVGKSSATAGVQALAERGLVNYDPYQYVTLTERGERAGRALLRRHRILKTFLMKVLGVPEPEAEAVGCKMEHAIKGRVLERFVRFLQFVDEHSVQDGSWRDAFEAFCREHGARDDTAWGQAARPAEAGEGGSS